MGPVPELQGRQQCGLWLGTGQPWAVRERCHAACSATPRPPPSAPRTPVPQFHSHQWDPGEPGTPTLPASPMFHQTSHPPDFTHKVFPEPSSAVSTRCGPMFLTAFSSASHTALCFVKGTCQLHFGFLPFQLWAIKTYCFHMLGKSKVMNHDFSMCSGHRPPCQPRVEDQGRHDSGLSGPGGRDLWPLLGNRNPTPQESVPRRVAPGEHPGCCRK